MPPLKQNTFLVLPNAPQNNFNHGAPPPIESLPRQPLMTSKQARKSYNERTRGQKRSRAEQREWERAEQERIRKELEKEQNAIKARAARERKKAKDQAVLDQKKKQGLPLVSVRPSQDTIARFIRKGNKREREPEQVAPQELRINDEEGIPEVENNLKSPSASRKRPRLSIIEEQDDDAVHVDPVPISPNIVTIPHSPSEAPRSDSHECLPSKSQEDAQTTTAQPATVALSPPQYMPQVPEVFKNPTRASQAVVDTTSLLDTDVDTTLAASLEKDRTVSEDKTALLGSLNTSGFNTMPHTKPLVLGQMGETVEHESHPAQPTEAAVPTTKAAATSRPNPSHSEFSGREKSRRSKLRFSTASNSAHQASTLSPALSVKQISMTPPSILSARKPLGQVSRDVATKQSQACSKSGHPIPSSVTKVTAVTYPQPQVQPEPMPPSNTQNFLETYILDILPTPSQEERELCGDENTKPGLMGPPPRPVPPTLSTANSRPRSFQSYATPKIPMAIDRSLKPTRQKFAPPPVPRWGPGHGPQTRAGQTNVRPRANASRSSNHPAPVAKVHQPPVADLEFLSTQDVMLSTQDVLEVEEPTISVPKKAIHTGPPRFLRQHASAKSDTKSTSASLNSKSSNLSASLSKSKDTPSTKPSALSSQHRASQSRRDPKISIEALFDSQDHKTAVGKNSGPRNSQSTPVPGSHEYTGTLGGNHEPDLHQSLEQSILSQSARKDSSSIESTGADDKAPRATNGSTDSEAPDSQGRPRYFTSSCTNIRIGLATLESMRTFEAEQRKREEQSKKREARALLAKEKQQAAEQRGRDDAALQKAWSLDSEAAGTGSHRDKRKQSLGSTCMDEQQAELDQFADDLIFTLSQEETEIEGAKVPLNSQALRRLPSGSKPLLGSTQETDYGDIDIGESLAMLEADNL